MKKVYSILTALVMCCLFATEKANAQNLQVQYDLSRGYWTTTTEMFRPDSFGSTYFFVDLDLNPRMTGAYWEISREFNFWQDTDWSWLSVHAEFNGGLSGAFSFNNCWLAGATYSGHSADFSKTWSLTASYKAIPGTVGLNGAKQPHNFQITGVWGINFLDGWCTFSGFFDFWREVEYIFISEPQFWVNLNSIKGWEKINLSLGGEVEFSVNFAGYKGFYARPAIGAKWTF